MKRIIIRTHGGLGNQIFQVFYALVNYQNNLILLHDDRYPHGFKLSKSLSKNFTTNSKSYEYFFSHSRLLKLIEKFSSKQPILEIGNTIYLDGYFQKTKLYESIPIDILSFGIENLRHIFAINKNPKRNSLCHIRLYDFFNTDHERLNAAQRRLTNLNDGTDFITTDDVLISEDPSCQKIIIKKNLNHITTSNYSAEDLLRLMSLYKIIESNDSTLAFWASVLNNGKLIVDDPNLKSLFSLFKSISKNYEL
jgi:hypothetical protein